MTTVLHLSASPRGDHSESLAIAETFLEHLPRRAPRPRSSTTSTSGTARCRNSGPPPRTRKWRSSPARRPRATARRRGVAARQTFERFAAADKYVFSIPMWNAGIPYILKQFIDVVSQPGWVFGFDPVEGYTGLVTGKKAAVVYTGAVYGVGRGPRFGSDFQMPYMRDWLQWAGIHDIVEVDFHPNLATEDAESGTAARARPRTRSRQGVLDASASPAGLVENDVNRPVGHSRTGCRLGRGPHSKGTARR